MPAPRVTVAKRVWSTWRRLAADEDEWEMQMLLSSSTDVLRVREVLRESVLEMQAEHEAAAAGSGDPDPSFAGEWSWMDVVGGVLVKVTESDTFVTALPAVADGLVRRGISGKFDVWRQPRGVTPPHMAPLLAARLRVVGDRERTHERAYWWRAQRDAYREVLAAAEGWCRRETPGAAYSLRIGTTGAVAITGTEDVLERLLDAVNMGDQAVLTTTVEDAFWCVAVDVSGGLLPVCGGSAIGGERWQRELGRLVELLRETADRLVYAYVMRGWHVQGALDGQSLSYDWPQRVDEQPRGIGGSWLAFEDLFAPDAFGVQLLGPGYADRLPELAGWEVSRAGKAARLVQHPDSEAWFARPLVPYGQLAGIDQRPSSPLLDRARGSLAPILYTRGVLAPLGYGDLRDA